MNNSDGVDDEPDEVEAVVVDSPVAKPSVFRGFLERLAAGIEFEQAHIEPAIEQTQEMQRIPKGTIKIQISGGVLTDVSGLPPGWTYMLVDWDDFECWGAAECLEYIRENGLNYDEPTDAAEVDLDQVRAICEKHMSDD